MYKIRVRDEAPKTQGATVAHFPGEHTVQRATMTFEWLTSVCRAFEDHYGMSSPHFYDMYKNGEPIEGMSSFDMTRWSSYHEFWLESRPDARPQIIEPIGGRELASA